MANLNITKSQETSNSHLSLELKLEETSYNINENTSYVTWELGMRMDSSGSKISGTFAWSISADGRSQTASVKTSIAAGKYVKLKSGGLTVSHNTDGTKVLSVGAALRNKVDCGMSVSFTLTDIPRASQPTTSASTVDFGQQVTINTNRELSTFAHRLYYSMNDGAEETISTSIGESYVWTIPLDLISRITTTDSATITFRLDTYNGNRNIGSHTVKITAKVPTNVVPTISSITHKETVAGLNEKFGAYVQYRSRIQVQVTATEIYGAGISSCTVKVCGISYNGMDITTREITQSGSVTITVTVKDSRNRSATKTETVTVSAYTYPSPTKFVAFRCDADGKADDNGSKVSIQYAFSIASMNDKNDHSAIIQYRKANATEWSQLLSNDKYSDNQSLIADPAFSSDYSWEFRLVLTDYFGSIEKSVTIPSAIVIFDMLKSGDGFAFGKTASVPQVLDIAWDVQTDKNVIAELGIVGNEYARGVQNVFAGQPQELYDGVPGIILNESGSASFASKGDVSLYFFPKLTTNPDNGSVKVLKVNSAGFYFNDVIHSDKGIVAGNNYGFYGRNKADSANIKLLSATNSDNIVLGAKAYPLYLWGSKIQANMLIQSGRTSTLDIPSNGHYDETITFKESFPGVPNVVATIAHANTSAVQFGLVHPMIVTGSSDKTKVLIRIFNTDTSTRKVFVFWVATYQA